VATARDSSGPFTSRKKFGTIGRSSWVDGIICGNSQGKASSDATNERLMILSYSGQASELSEERF
jgi:hypothetical protein